MRSKRDARRKAGARQRKSTARDRPTHAQLRSSKPFTIPASGYTRLSGTPSAPSGTPRHQRDEQNLLVVRTVITRALLTVLATVLIIGVGYKMQQREHQNEASKKQQQQQQPQPQPQQPQHPDRVVWTAQVEMLGEQVQKTVIYDEATKRLLTLGEVVDLWSNSEEFAAFYTSMLRKAPFETFFWEMPPTTQAQLAAHQASYEHVVVKAGGFAAADPAAFADHFEKCGESGMATSFASLGGDAMLVAPCERAERAHYGHLAAFVRGSVTPVQQAALWRTVANELRRTLAKRGEGTATWLSTEGSGVPWLHVRLDSRPKYYHHQPYRARPKHGPNDS